MKITGVTCQVLLDPGFERDATSSAQDTIIVEVQTDEGLVGIGETDLNAWIGAPCVLASHSPIATGRRVVIPKRVLSGDDGVSSRWPPRCHTSST